MSQPLTYKDAGVDIDAGEESARRIKSLVAATATSQVLSQVGSFGGLFHLAGCSEGDPVLVSSIDGVGTKMKVAAALGRYNTVGHDIVNHCTNDILVQGARPLFFLDYIGAHRVEPAQVATIVQGISEACLTHGCALIGGETAEMPDVYGPGDLDLVGVMVGVVDRARVLDGSRVCPGDRLVGLASSGLHTNGYTLARRALFGDSPEKLSETPSGWQRTVGEALLEPHRSYFKVLWPLLEEGRIHALAHITGGGIPGNLCRVIPNGLGARVYIDRWERPPLFSRLAEKTQAPPPELFRAFNMGIGMIAVVSPEETGGVLGSLRTSCGRVWEIGEVTQIGSGNRTVEMID